MNNVHLVIMGKTGAGKSTLVNSILGRHCAQTGIGAAQTIENRLYEADHFNCHLRLLDTVGLELDSEVNTKTLQEIENRLHELSEKYVQGESDLNDVYTVWYCVNPNNNRFEDFEADFIKKMMLEYEIPFVVVMTQCWDSNHAENMKQEINQSLPGVPIECVLAEEYKVGNVRIEAYGVDNLFSETIRRFNEYKIDILGKKLEMVQERQTISENKIEEHVKRSRKIVEKYAKRAFAAGCVPGVSLVSMQTTYQVMYQEITAEFGIGKLPSDELAGFMAICFIGLISAPILIIPVASGAWAKKWVRQAGESYINTLSEVLRQSTEAELDDGVIMAERIKKELERRKNRS